MSSVWLFLVVIGPVLVLGELLRAGIRTRSRANLAKAEKAARQLQRKITQDPQYMGDG